MFQDETFQWSRKSQVFYIAVTKIHNYWQIFVNIVTLFTRSICRFFKYIEDSHLGFSKIVRFSVSHRKAIVAKLVLSLTQLFFPSVMGIWTHVYLRRFALMLYMCTSWTHARMNFVRKYKCRKCDQIQWKCPEVNCGKMFRNPSPHTSFGGTAAPGSVP